MKNIPNKLKCDIICFFIKNSSRIRIVKDQINRNPQNLGKQTIYEYLSFLQFILSVQFMLLIILILFISLQYGRTACSLDRFPQEIFFANRIDGLVEIEEYVETVYPLMNVDLTHPLEAQQLKKIDFSKKFVKNSPFPHHIVPNVNGDFVKFQVMDLRNQNLVQQSGSFLLKDAHKCQYIFLPNYPFNLSNIFIHCKNQTHFDDSIINRFLDLKNTTTSLPSYKIYQSNQQQVYYQMNYGLYPTVSDIIFLHRLGEECIIDFYTQSSSFYRKLQRTCEELGKEIKGEFAISDFGIQSNISKLFVLQTGKLAISLANTNTIYNMWYIDGQYFLKCISLCQTSITAVLSSNYLYFVSIDLTPGSLMFIMFQQIARIKLERPISSQIEMNSIGKYVVISDGKQWIVYYMENGKIKMMVFDCQINVSEIYIDNMLCGTDVFYFRNKKYTLATMKIIKKNQSQQKITIIAKDCSKTIILKTMNSSDIVEINGKNSLLCRDGTLNIEQIMCIGNNLTQKLVISSKEYPIKNKQFNFSFSQQALQYIELNYGIILLTKKSSSIRIYAFIDDYNLFKDIEVTGKIKSIKMIKKAYKNYYKGTSIVIFITLDNNGEKLVQICILQLYKVPGQKIYQLKLVNNEWSYDFYGLYSFQFMSFQVITIISTSWFSYEEIDEHTKINLIGLTYVKQKTKFVHMKTFFTMRSSRGVQLMILEDQESVNADGMCKMEQNIAILYKMLSNAVQLTSVRDISDYYQIMNTDKRVYNKQVRIICGREGLSILYDNSIEIIDKNLKVAAVYHLNQPTKDDIIISNYIIHKSSSDVVQIYCIKTGFLISQMRSVNIKDIVPSHSSNGVLLKNGSYYSIEKYQTISDIQSSESFASLICSNTFNSIFKLKALQSKDTLSLSTFPTISVPASIAKLNFLNSTVQNMQIFINSQYKNISHIRQFRSDGSPWGKYQILIINNTNIFSGCRRDNYNYIDCIAVSEDGEGDERLLTQWLVSLSEGADNRFVQVFANRTMLEVISFRVSEGKATLVNSSMFCKLEASLIDQDYLSKPSAKHSLIDEKYLYLLRDEIQTWNSHSQFFTIEGTIFPKAFRNTNSLTNKIEIYGLNGQCKIDEITPQKFGINKSVSDFALIKRKESTFVIIIFVDEIIIFQYPLSSGKKQFYHAQLTQQFIAITAINDKFVLLSEKNDHKMYSINWQSFPLAGTIQFQKTFIKTGEQSIIDGTMSNDMLVAYSKTNVFIFYLDSKNRQSYSSQSRHMNGFKLNNQFHCDVDLQAGIDYIKYQEQNMFTMGIVGQYCQDYLNFQVMPMVDLQGASKIRLSNRKYSKEYQIVYGNNLREE